MGGRLLWNRGCGDYPCPPALVPACVSSGMPLLHSESLSARLSMVSWLFCQTRKTKVCSFPMSYPVAHPPEVVLISAIDPRRSKPASLSGQLVQNG